MYGHIAPWLILICQDNMKKSDSQKLVELFKQNCVTIHFVQLSALMSHPILADLKEFQVFIIKAFVCFIELTATF